MNYDMPNPLHYAADLIKEPSLSGISRHYMRWVIAGLVLPGVVGGVVTGTVIGAVTGAIWGGLVRLFVSAQITWSINSVCHMIGHRHYETDDHSVNNMWLAIPSFGEAWHNNHHQRPNSASFSSRRSQLDLGYWTIMALWLTGLAWNVKCGIRQSALVRPEDFLKCGEPLESNR
ncbi:hypothetical protein BH10PLA2_BH10PLA2_12620 [soil metagenome]